MSATRYEANRGLLALDLIYQDVRANEVVGAQEQVGETVQVIRAHGRDPKTAAAHPSPFQSREGTHRGTSSSTHFDYGSAPVFSNDRDVPSIVHSAVHDAPKQPESSRSVNVIVSP